ncbi:MAG: substrate-binding domain-containing protein [Bacillota bacterium]|nr:substrate-binding domain-containing protein [Bacillota bacterium]
MRILRGALIISVTVLFVLSALLCYKYLAQKDMKQSGRIVVVLKDYKNPSEFWKVVKAGIDTAAKEYNVKVEYTGADSESNIEGQIKILNEVCESKPEAIILAASDYCLLVPMLERIDKAGIRVINIDSRVNSNIPKCFISTDNLDAGRKAGKKLSDIVDMNSKLAIISYVKGSTTAIEREHGVLEYLNRYRQGKVVGTFFCDNNQSMAYKIVMNLMSEHPDIGGIACLNENSTVGATKALTDLGLGGKVKLVGFDSSFDEIKYLEKGLIQATVVQKPFNMGYLGLKTAVQSRNGNNVVKRIDTGSVLVTKDTMHTEENQKLLFPFVEK